MGDECKLYCIPRIVDGCDDCMFTALQAENALLRERLQESSRIVEKYKDACMGWAKDSHHKGKKQNTLFWSRRAKSMAVLLNDIKQALKEQP